MSVIILFFDIRQNAMAPGRVKRAKHGIRRQDNK